MWTQSDLLLEGYLGITYPLQPPVLIFLYYSFTAHVIFRTHCQYRTTSRTDFLSKKGIVLKTIARSMFPWATEIRRFERKDLQTERKLRAEKVNEVLQDFTACQTLNLASSSIWNVCLCVFGKWPTVEFLAAWVKKLGLLYWINHPFDTSWLISDILV